MEKAASHVVFHPVQAAAHVAHMVDNQEHIL